jgi:hypothetical protein
VQVGARGGASFDCAAPERAIGSACARALLRLPSEVNELRTGASRPREETTPGWTG